VIVARAHFEPSRATHRATLAIAAALAIDLATPASLAQSRTGFAVNRFEPAERGSRHFVVDSLDLRAGSAAAGATLDYAYKPLVIYDASGTERYALVRHQTMLHLGGAVVVFDRLRLALDAPIAIYQDGEAAVVAGEALSASTAPAVGDVRLAADVRVVGAGDPSSPFTLAVGVRAWLPSGLRSPLTSGGSARVAPQVHAAGAAGAFVWAARAAVVYRSRDDDYAGRALGSELFGGVGVGLRTHDGTLTVGPELYAASAFTGGAKLFGERETAVEWVLGAHYDLLRDVRAGAGVGGGLGHGYGTPVLRGLLSLEWVVGRAREAPRTEEPPEPRTPWEGGGGGEGEGDGAATPKKPLAVVTDTEIEIREEIRFATDSADLLGDSDDVLAAVKRILDEHPELRRIRIEGHTDAVGDPAYNDDLSARRAAAVQAWLVGQGGDASRLECGGRGSRDAIDTNETEAGRAKNRRVVFRIVEH
jgi:outer membrane protein OmpA-like peptidoglycan-associated protein